MHSRGDGSMSSAKAEPGREGSKGSPRVVLVVNRTSNSGADTGPPQRAYPLPGSTQLAQQILSDRRNYEIQAFEIVEAYAAGLRHRLGERAILTRTATPADWTEWRPDLLFLDPPCLRNARKPEYPTLRSMMQLAEGIENVLMWLPMAGEVGSCETAVSPAATNRKIMNE